MVTVEVEVELLRYGVGVEVDSRRDGVVVTGPRVSVGDECEFARSEREGVVEDFDSLEGAWEKAGRVRRVDLARGDCDMVESFCSIAREEEGKSNG